MFPQVEHEINESDALFGNGKQISWILPVDFVVHRVDGVVSDEDAIK